jgi:hypothetical protein
MQQTAMQRGISRIQDDGAAMFTRNRALDYQQSQESARLSEQTRSNRANEQYRYDEMAQNQDQFDATLADREDARAATAPNQTITDLEGNQYQGTRQQAVEADNLATMGEEKGGDYSEGLRRILGLPEPMTDYEAPDGSVTRVPLKQLPTLKQRDAAAAAKQANDDNVLQTRRAATQAALDARYAAIDQSAKAASDRLDLGYARLQQHANSPQDKLAIAQMKAKLKTQADLANNDIAAAKASLKAYMDAQPYKKSDDPHEAQLRKAVDDAYAQKRELLKQQLEAANHLEEAGVAPPATQPAAASTAPATQAATPAQNAAPATQQTPAQGTVDKQTPTPDGVTSLEGLPDPQNAVLAADGTGVVDQKTGKTSPVTPEQASRYHAAWLQKRFGSTNLPPGQAAMYLQRAGGDKDKAREMAKADGWSF